MSIFFVRLDFIKITKCLFSHFHCRYKVSNFALTLLTEFADQSLIRVVDFSPFLPKKVTRLKQAIDLRSQSKIVGSYIEQCRFAEEIKSQVEDLISIKDPETMSLNELCSVQVRAI